MKTLGVVFVSRGLLALNCGDIDCNRKQTIVQMGSMEIAAAEHRRVPTSALAGLAVAFSGVAFLVGGVRRGVYS